MSEISEFNSSATFVIKTVERCNINCSYCYFFNGIDHSFAKHSPYISQAVIDQITAFLKQGAQDFNLKKIFISFHGGEPLMQKKAHFDAMCSLLRSQLSPFTNVYFSVQTNGILLNEEWLDLLARHEINIGLSLDGPAHYHDKYRITKQNKGTYDKILVNIEKIKKHPYYQKHGIGILTVINPEFDPIKIYRHFIDELQFDTIDFLMPDYNHHYLPPFGENAVGSFIVTLLKEWMKDDNPKIKIRLFESFVDMVLHNKSCIYGFSPANNAIPLITISSDGDLAPADELRSANPAFMTTDKTVFNSTLKDFISHPVFDIINGALETIPPACSECCWKNICRGGPLLNRFSQSNQFNNASIYCKDLKNIFSSVTAYLLNNGIPFSKIQSSILG